MTPPQNETQALIALVTNEWRPLPLNEISAITGKAPSQCGVVFRHRLGLTIDAQDGRNAERGRVYIHDAYGHRFARCYRTSGAGTRYWWRRFPEGTTDADVLKSAQTIISTAFLAKPTPAVAVAVASHPLSLFTASTPTPNDAAQVDSVANLAADIVKAAAELERLTSLRDRRIAALQAQIDALRG